ncbi:hypothetical protein COB64_02935 [Candidatus Wolfebacteria bacterium]|nr:MAG: hypothetical protein COB64_02935 [Candidatus Wolfebacteria bacterium]
MKDKEFTGELREVPPSRLFNKLSNNSIDNFFLVLAVVYNDIKGIIFFQNLLVDTYRTPAKRELSLHTGEYSGLHIQLIRLIIGIVHEFFKLLEKNKPIFSTPEFKKTFNSTNSSTENLWNEILELALDKVKGDGNFINNLAEIRHNISFHYNQDGKQLRKSFLSLFFEREKMIFNELAYYSSGDNMTETRFFYADAVTEEYMRLRSKKKEYFDSMSSYSSELMELVVKMNTVISDLLKSYLKNLPKGVDEQKRRVEIKKTS